MSNRYVKRVRQNAFEHLIAFDLSLDNVKLSHTRVVTFLRKIRKLTQSLQEEDPQYKPKFSILLTYDPQCCLGAVSDVIPFGRTAYTEDMRTLHISCSNWSINNSDKQI